MFGGANRLDKFSFAVRHSTDAYLHSQSATGWMHVYEQLARGTFGASAMEVWLGPVQIIHDRINVPVAYQGRPWGPSRVFVVYSPGLGDFYHDGRLMPTNVLMTHRACSLERAFCNRKAECVVVAIDEDFFERYVHRSVGRSFFPDGRRATTFTALPHGAERMRACALEDRKSVV